MNIAIRRNYIPVLLAAMALLTPAMSYASARKAAPEEAKPLLEGFHFVLTGNLPDGMPGIAHWSHDVVAPYSNALRGFPHNVLDGLTTGQQRGAQAALAILAHQNVFTQHIDKLPVILADYPQHTGNVVNAHAILWRFPRLKETIAFSVLELWKSANVERINANLDRMYQAARARVQ